MSDDDVIIAANTEDVRLVVIVRDLGPTISVMVMAQMPTDATVRMLHDIADRIGSGAIQPTREMTKH